MERILGIDFGTKRTGWSVALFAGERFRIIDSGVIRPDGNTNFEKIFSVYRAVARLVTKFRVQKVMIEAPFIGRNGYTSILLAKVQAAAVIAALAKKVAVEEVPPKTLKKFICANGSASKEQVARRVTSILKLKKLPEPDEADAIALSILPAFKASVAL